MSSSGVDVKLDVLNDDWITDPSVLLFRRDEMEGRLDLSKVIMMKDPTLEALIDGKYDSPFDIKTFWRFCERRFCEEQLNFVLTVRKFRELQPAGELYAKTVRRIADCYLRVGAESEVNVSSRLREKVLASVDKAAEGPPDWMIFSRPEAEVFRMLRNDVFVDFQNEVRTFAHVQEARTQALWCAPSILRGMSLRSFFSFPNPVDAVHARLLHLIASILLIGGIVENQFSSGFGSWCYVVVLYGFVARTLCGARLDPTYMFVLFVVDPIIHKFNIAEPRYLKNKARRFAEANGVLFNAVILVAAMTGLLWLAWTLAGVFSLGGLLHGYKDSW